MRPRTGGSCSCTSDDARGRAAQRPSSVGPPTATRQPAVRAIAPEAVPSTRDWNELLARERPDVLVAWVVPAQLQSLPRERPGSRDAAGPHLHGRGLHRLAGVARAARASSKRVLHVYPYSLPAPGLAQFPREDRSGSGRSASTVSSRSLPPRPCLPATRPARRWPTWRTTTRATTSSRRWSTCSTARRMTTLFPVTTLGTGQRYLAKGAYVLRLAPDTGASRYVSSGWIQP